MHYMVQRCTHRAAVPGRLTPPRTAAQHPRPGGRSYGASVSTGPSHGVGPVGAAAAVLLHAAASAICVAKDAPMMNEVKNRVERR